MRSFWSFLPILMVVFSAPTTAQDVHPETFAKTVGRGEAVRAATKSPQALREEFDTALRSLRDAIEDARTKISSEDDRYLITIFESAIRFYSLSLEPWKLAEQARASGLDPDRAMRMVEANFRDGNTRLNDAENFIAENSVSRSPKDFLVAATKFHDAYRAGKAMQAGLDVGISYKDFNQTLREFATEVAMLDGTASSHGERRVVQKLNDALEEYKLSETAWSEEIVRKTKQLVASEAEQKLLAALANGRQLRWHRAAEVLSDVGKILAAGKIDVQGIDGTSKPSRGRGRDGERSGRIHENTSDGHS